MRILFTTIIALVFCLIGKNAYAQSALNPPTGIEVPPDIPRFEHLLTEQDVLKYIKANKEIEQFHKDKLSSLQARFQKSLDVAAPLDGAGYVALHRHTYNDLATRDEKALLDDIHSKAGFSLITGDWPETSDRIFSAYLKLQTERGAYAVLNAMSDTFLDRLPREQVVQIKQSKIMFEAAENLTSDIDLAIVRPHLRDLEIAMKDKIGG